MNEVSEAKLFQIQYEYWRVADDHPQGGYRTITSCFVVAGNLDGAMQVVRDDVGGDLMSIQSAVQLSNEENRLLSS